MVEAGAVPETIVVVCRLLIGTSIRTMLVGVPLIIVATVEVYPAVPDVIVVV